MRILGIETSCDETAAAVVEYKRGRFRVRSNVVYSQVALHAKTGGVVPEVAAREHCVKIVPVLKKALAQAKATKRTVDAIAVTSGPGLITSLVVGVEAARTLAYVWKKPLVAVNHIEAHVTSCWLANEKIRFPALCMVVSGGHTELILVPRLDQYRCVGRTQDDAAGEAFDKVATLLGLGFPGGPAIARAATNGDRERYSLPRPMLHSKDFNFSFAGVKTAVLYLVQGINPRRSTRSASHIQKNDLAASFQQAVIDVLIQKTITAANRYRVRSVLLAGGVAANSELRRTLATEVDRRLSRTTYHQPALEYCTDNAAMIAARAAWAFSSRRKKSFSWQSVSADPNWEIR